MLKFLNALLPVAVCVFFSCKKETPTPGGDDPLSDLNLPAAPYNYAVAVNLPEHFKINAPGPLQTSVNGLDNAPLDNPVTDHGATLGRVLFYDKKLSGNGRVSCASCHVQESGFSDPERLSKGFEGGLTRRHSMTLINARFYQRGRFFWDERAATLEQQVLQPFQDPVEMGLSLGELVKRVEDQPYYPRLFKNAFGDESVSADRIARALAQFVRSIISYQSRYDVGRAQVPNPNAPFPNFTPQENQGKQLFLQPVQNGGAGCFACHTTEAFVSANIGPQNNGLDSASTSDRGAAETFPQQTQLTGAFKTGTLRNIALTAPYMHDGRFATLEEVVEHYNSGVKGHPNLAPPLRRPDGQPQRLNLSEGQKAALVAFMRTLTDESVAANPKWSNPFK
ncbi:MAG: cytochrome-c peroxidase [Saprospiraceae bacterium]